MLKKFLLIILFLVTVVFFSENIESFEDHFEMNRKLNTDTANTTSISDFNAIQNELDNLNLKLRSSETSKIISIYLPSYGVIIKLDYNKNVQVGYGNDSLTDEEKQNYFKVTSMYSFIIKNMAAIKSIKPDDYIIVQIKCANMFVQRIIQQKNLVNLYLKNAEFNIIQSLLKFETDPKIPKNRILKDVPEYISSTILNIENENFNPILKVPNEIENRINENTKYKVVTSYNSQFGVIVFILNPAMVSDDEAKDLIEDLTGTVYKIIKNYKDSNWLYVIARKQGSIFGGTLNTQNIFSEENIEGDIKWWSSKQE